MQFLFIGEEFNYQGVLIIRKQNVDNIKISK